MRLTDFGLAKRNINTSQRDTACGTPLYMPPEAIDNMRDGGESASTAAAVSPARHGTASLSSSASCIASSSGGGSTPTNPLCLFACVSTTGGYGLPVDWWMLGTLLYEMLFARTPFEHQDMHVLWSKIQTDDLEFPVGSKEATQKRPADHFCLTRDSV